MATISKTSGRVFSWGCPGINTFPSGVQGGHRGGHVPSWPALEVQTHSGIPFAGLRGRRTRQVGCAELLSCFFGRAEFFSACFMLSVGRVDLISACFANNSKHPKQPDDSSTRPKPPRKKIGASQACRITRRIRRVQKIIRRIRREILEDFGICLAALRGTSAYCGPSQWLGR